MVRIEEIALNISQVRADGLRWKVRKLLEKAKLPKANITKLEKLEIKTLQRNEIIILSAEKGNVTIVLDITKYTGKLEDIVTNGSYSKERSNK